MDQIDTLSTLRKITAGEPESYAEAVVHNMRSAYEIIGMIEQAMMSAWDAPHHNHEDAAIDMIEEVVVNSCREVEQVTGLRLTILEHLGGNGLVRDVMERFQLLQQTKEVMRKLIKLRKDKDTDKEDKKKIVAFIAQI